MPNTLYGIDAYPDWNNFPMGGGCGYLNNSDLPNLYGPKDPDTGYLICEVDTVDRLNTALSLHALNSQGQCVIIFRSPVDDNHSPPIDFSNETAPIEIPANTFLFGYRGWGVQEGALLFTTKSKAQPLFKVTGPNVRISGLRFAGYDLANPWIVQKDIPTCAIFGTQSDLEVENCEFYGWTRAAVRVQGVGLQPPGPISTEKIIPISDQSQPLDNIFIHHNYIHHNQQSPPGYGMTGDNSYYTVFANIFDYNWSSIAGTGDPGTSYEAKFNLQLNNSSSHAFDMHPLNNIYNKPGGDGVLIHYNSFWLWQKAAIGIAIPLGPNNSEIYYNFFAQPLWSSENPTSNNDYIDQPYGTWPYSLINPNIVPTIIIQHNQYGKMNNYPFPSN